MNAINLFVIVFFFSFRTHTHVWLFQCIVGGAKVSKK